MYGNNDLPHLECVATLPCETV